jgi:hypothetical protein
MPRTTIFRAVRLALVVSNVWPAVVFAQSPTQGAAEASFTEGVKLMKEGRCEEAVGKFQESERLDPASGTLLNLAYCEARLGRVASAWLDYRRAIPLAQQKQRPQHEKIAREQADKLEPDLPRLSVAVAGGERTILIELDGESLPRAMWSVPVPVDPGAHRVKARLESGRDWEKSVTLARAERASVEIPVAEPAPAATVAPLVPVTPPVQTGGTGAVGAVPPGTTPGITGPVEPPPTHEQATSRPGWALATGVIGAGAIVAGTALFVSARLQYDAASKHCDENNVCNNDQDINDERSATKRFHVALGVFGGGVVLAGVGAIFYFSGGKSQASSQRGPIVLTGGRDGWGLGWRGAF